jgi:solute:Na+ symporter, SSS family
LANSFHIIDWIIVGAYLAAMGGVGAYFSRRQKNLNQFLRAESRMGWLPIGLSLMAALNSGMDYLMQPSSTIRYGAVLVVGIVSWLPLYPWVARVAFPFFQRLNYFTVYEYLEARFDIRVRTMAAVIFVLWRVGWMGTAMYVPSLAINAATGGQVDLNTVTIIVGVLVTSYTMMGGIEAVIWNDVIQFCIMFGGLAATVAIVWASVPGGLAEIWSAASAAGKLEIWHPLAAPGTSALPAIVSFFEQPINVIALLVALIVGRMAQYTSDQVMVQRLQSTRSLAEARQAFVVNAAGDALWMIGLSFVGFALFAYFQHHVLPESMQSDKLVPYFMSLAFPAGAVGLVIAAIMAASLSSIDSAINSCTSVAVIDFYNRLWKGRNLRPEEASANNDKTQVLVSRIMTALFGAAGTILACNVSRVGSLLEINAKVVNAFTGPLFGMFLLAMFAARVGSTVALIAGGAGAVAAYLVAYQSPIGFMWPSTFGLVATLLVGVLLSLVAPLAQDDARRRLTWREVMRKGAPARV